MAQDPQWIFDDSELPSWAQGASPSARRQAPFWSAVPAERNFYPTTTLTRLLIWRTAFAAFFFPALYFGRVIVAEGRVAEYAVIAALIGFAIAAYYVVQAIGSVDYWNSMIAQQRQKTFQSKVVDIVGLVLGKETEPEPVPEAEPQFYHVQIVILLYYPLVGAATVIAAAGLQYVFLNRQLALTILSLVCVALHFHFVKQILRFSRDRMLVSYLVPPKIRERYCNLAPTPDLVPLAIALTIAVVVPAISSVTLGIFVLVLFLTLTLVRQIKQLSPYGNWRLALGALQMRARHTVFDFCDYQHTLNTHWRPPQSRRQRLMTMMLLSAAIDLSLLSALTCFFPWELAASFTVPGYELPFSAFKHYATGDLRWLLTPIELASAAESLPLYLSGIVVAIPLFILIPPVVLFLTYFNGLVQLEGIHQETKRHDGKE